MKLTRLILCGVLTVLSAAATQAGPLRNLAARVFHHGGCGGGCSSAPLPAPSMGTVTMPSTGETVHVVTYLRAPDGQAVPVVSGQQTYPQPIRLGFQLPTTCPNCPR